jgi:hypothetical protein
MHWRPPPPHNNSLGTLSFSGDFLRHGRGESRNIFSHRRSQSGVLSSLPPMTDPCANVDWKTQSSHEITRVKVSGKPSFLPPFCSWAARYSSAMRYLPTETLPTGIPSGYVLVHNRVAHSKNQRSSIRGFRAWFQKSRANLVRCKCGWSGLPHYRVKRNTRTHGVRKSVQIES